MKTFLLTSFLLLSFMGFAQTETDQQRQMAKQMMEMIDRMWDMKPEEGANLRFLLKKDGEPMKGKISIHGQFDFFAKGRMNSTQNFNPTQKGYFIYEGITPGTYTLIINGRDEMEGFSWKREGVVVKEGEAPVFEVEVK